MKLAEAQKHKIEDCMPTTGAIHSYVNYANTVATNSSRMYHLGAAIPIMLNELNLRGIHLREMIDQKKPRPFTVMSLLLGSSGDGKSTAAATAMSHIAGFLEQEEVDQVYQRKRLLPFDGTPEGLRYALATEFFSEEQQATIALIYQEELTTVFQRAHGAVGEFLLRIYDGRDIAENQRQHQRASTSGFASHATIRAPRVNGLFCSTSALLSKTVTQAIAMGGLFGRLLIFTAEDRKLYYEGSIARNPDWERVRQEWLTENCEDLAQWSLFLDTHRTGAANGALSISNEAHDVFEARHTVHQHLRDAGTLNENMQAMLARANRTSWTIAALYATTQLRSVVSADDARRATKLVDYCFNMGEELSTMFEQSEGARRTSAVLKAITKSKTKGTSTTDIHHAPGINGKGIKKIELHEILETLLDAGSIQKIQRISTKGGRPATLYYASRWVPEQKPTTEN